MITWRRWSSGACSSDTHTQDGARMSLRYWQVPWMQKSLYFFMQGFLFFPRPLPFFFAVPLRLFPSVVAASRMEDGSLGLLDMATKPTDNPTVTLCRRAKQKATRGRPYLVARACRSRRRSHRPARIRNNLRPPLPDRT